MHIALDDPARPDVFALLEEHLRHMRAISPPESVHALDVERLKLPEISFWTARDGDRLLGCGALKHLHAEHGEIKSMRTPAALRRRGAGRALLAHIVNVARDRGYTRVSLETGAMAAFAPAHELYRRFGFVRCGPFADYQDDPNSIFMTLSLQEASFSMPEIDGCVDSRSRLMHASVEQIFSAFSDADRLARWWGPDGFTSTIHDFAFCEGATWQLTLHGPDGGNFANTYRVLRIEAGRTIVLDHPSDDHHFVLSLDFEALGEQTRVHWQQRFDRIEDYAPIADFLALANEQVLARLEAEAQRT